MISSGALVVSEVIWLSTRSWMKLPFFLTITECHKSSEMFMLFEVITTLPTVSLLAKKTSLTYVIEAHGVCI